MRKLIVVLLSCTLLQGCFWQSTKPIAIKAGDTFCKNEGGLYSLDSWWYGGTDIVCNSRYFVQGRGKGKVVGENWIELETYLKREYLK